MEHVVHQLLEIVLRTSIIYTFLLIGVRIGGKREMGQMTPFDLVLLLTISNAVQNAMVGDNNTVTGGIAAASTLLAWNFVMGIIALRSVRARHLLEGTPTVLVAGGKIVAAGMRKERITMDDLEAATREHGISSVEEVDLAVMEVDGTISIIKYEDGGEHRRTRRGFRQLQKKP